MWPANFGPQFGTAGFGSSDRKETDMSSIKLVRKPDGWWLEIHNEGNSAADALISLGENHGLIVERALAQMEASQKDNEDEMEELQDENADLRDVISKINNTLLDAKDNGIIA